MTSLLTYGLATDDFAENDMLAVEVGGRGSGNEELRSVSIRPCICLRNPRMNEIRLKR